MNGNIEGGIVFSDLDGNGSPDIVAVTDAGTVSVFHLDGNLYHHFPINNSFPFTGPPLIVDMDDDSDFEVLGGAINSLSVFDIKEIGNNSVYWNMFRGNNKRTGYFSGGFECSVYLGDVNGDTIVNILDLVQISNYI